MIPQSYCPQPTHRPSKDTDLDTASTNRPSRSNCEVQFSGKALPLPPLASADPWAEMTVDLSQGYSVEAHRAAEVPPQEKCRLLGHVKEANPVYNTPRLGLLSYRSQGTLLRHEKFELVQIRPHMGDTEEEHSEISRQPVIMNKPCAPATFTDLSVTQQHILNVSMKIDKNSSIARR